MERLKSIFDWDSLRTALLGAVGYISTHFDVVVARGIALLTLAILVNKAYRVFFKKEDKKED